MSVKEIFDAIEKGNTSDLARLIAAGSNVNERCIAGLNFTPLQYAATKDSLECAKILIAAGADINARTDGGNTALMEACSYDSISMVHFLIRSGAKLDCKNDNGYTATMLAAQAGYYYCLSAMVEAGADLAVRNDEGKTAFTEAIDAENSPADKAGGAEHRACIEFLSEKMENIPKLVTLLYAVGAPFYNRQEIFDEINSEFGKATTSEERSSLLGTLVSVMNVILPTIPEDKVDEIKEANRKIYLLYLTQESLVDGYINGETLYEVTNREINAGRMTEDDSLRKAVLEDMAARHNTRSELITEKDEKVSQPQKKPIWKRLLGI